MKFFQIVMSVVVGLAAGRIPVTSCNLGAGRRDRLVQLLKYMMATEALIGLVFTLFFVLCPDLIIAAFGGQAEGIEYVNFSRICIRSFLLLLPFSCVNKATFIFLQSLGYCLLSAGLSIVREIVLGAGLPVVLGMLGGLYGLIWFMAESDFITILIAVPVWIWTAKQLKSGTLSATEMAKV